MFRRRFVWKIYAGLVAVIVLTAVVVGILVSWRIERDSMREIEQSLHDKATLLRDVALLHFQTGGDPSLQERVRALGATIHTRLTVVRADGVVVADSEEDPARMDNHGARPEVLDAKIEGIGTSERHSDTLDMQMMYLALPVREGKQLHGFVRAALPLVTVQERLARVRGVVAVGAVIAVGAALVISVLIARRVTGPLASMTRVAEAIADGDYSRRSSTQTRDEIGQLAGALDRMSGQLRERMERITADRNEVLAILASMVEGVVAVDQDERIVHMNTAAADMLGVSAPGQVGKPIWEVTRIHEVCSAVSKAVESAAGVTGEVKRAGRSGDRVLEMQAAPLRDSDGNPAGAVVVLHDVTQLRRLETVRQDFVANVSHELKTPLTAIRGLVETLLDDGAMDEATRQRFLTKLRDQTARVSALMTDLLAISQIESRETALEVEMLDLRDPIRESLKALLPSAEKKGVTVESEVPDEPVTESCDAEAIRRVFDNLLDNAVKYTPEEGRVWVRLRTEGDSALVEVADTGIGIEPRDQERIFERFYRVDKARSRELGGTGLGLSIVKHIVQAHGGEVSVESVPGRGSTFRVRLPLAS